MSQTSEKRIGLIGASNIDYYAQTTDAFTMYDSNLGRVLIDHGGVGRNITENLARLGVDTLFLTLLGQDVEGAALLKRLNLLGVDVQPILCKTTSRYVAMLDPLGDLLIGVADMQSLSELNPSFLSKHLDRLTLCAGLVLDANLSSETLAFMIDNTHVPIYADAISVAKATRLERFLDQITTLKVNRHEAPILSGLSKDASPRAHVKALLAKGVSEVFLTLGEQGACHGIKGELIQTRRAFKVPLIMNATGAGDAFMAGVIYAHIHQKNPLDYGLAMAAITLQSSQAVSQDLTLNQLECYIKEQTQ